MVRTISTEVILTRFLTLPSGWTTSPGNVSFQRYSSFILCLRSRSRRGRLCCLSTLIVFVAETAGVSFWTLSFLLSIESVFPFLTIDQYSCLNPFISNLGSFVFWSFYLSVSSPWSSTYDNSALIDFDQFLVHTLLTLSERCTESHIRILYKLSRILSVDISLEDTRACSHLVSKSWMSSPLKRH